MVSSIEEKKKKIEEQIEKNLSRKKMLLAQEKRKRAARFSDIGRLAYQANIDQIEESALFGAFIEISKMISEEKINEWKKRSDEFFNISRKNSDLVYCISFLEDPPIEIKHKLKEKKFSWNRFRKEYYGECNLEEIENLLKDCKVKIEEIKH